MAPIAADPILATATPPATAATLTARAAERYLIEPDHDEAAGTAAVPDWAKA